MDVSVIIVNYNTCRMTSECIDSVFEKTQEVSFEVILVDNASVDESKLHFESDTRIRYIYSYENMGFGRANNVGMMLAQGKYFFLLNSDTLLDNNAIKLFYDFAESKQQQIAFYGCWLQNKEKEYIHSCGNIPSISSILTNELFYILKRIKNNASFFVEDIPYRENSIFEVGYVTGADMFFHRKIYEDTGGFDHNFFMYYEESDWQRRAKNLGYKAYCINSPKIIHLVGGSRKKTKGVDLNSFKISLKSELYFVKKYYSKIKYYVFRLLLFLALFPHVIVMRWANSKDRLLALKLLF